MGTIRRDRLLVLLTGEATLLSGTAPPDPPCFPLSNARAHTLSCASQPWEPSQLRHTAPLPHPHFSFLFTTEPMISSCRWLSLLCR